MPSSTPMNAEAGDDSKQPHRYENSENSSSGGDAALVAAASQAASLATAAAAAACVNHSVVPDLMRVYESMTQTSNSVNSPSKGGGGSSNTANDSSQETNAAYGVDYMTGEPGGGAMMHHPHYFDPAPHQGDTSNLYYAGGWGNYDASALNIPIPAPYSFPLQQQSHPIDPRFSRNEHAAEAPSGRPVRAKRTMAAVLDDEGGGTGYDSSAGSSGRGGASKSRRKSSSKNNRSAGGNTRSATEKNEDKNDGRWSKRFTWPDDLHRDFVSAIFDVGLKHSSPSTVMEHMPPHEQITTERIKSHLQKYRLHRQKAKKEFMTSYQATMQQMNADGLDGVTSLAGGQVAAHLAYASQHHPDPEPEAVDESGGGGRGDEEAPAGGPEDGKHTAATAAEEPQHDVFLLPNLTEAEKVSPIGVSLGYLMGLFFSLRQQLDVQRQEQAALLAAQAQQEQNAHLGGTSIAVFEDFVTDGKSTTVAPVHIPVQSSSRSNLEANSLIKREMQNQMAFQNKMRALKQQELNKYSKAADSEATSDDKASIEERARMTTDPHRRPTGKQALQEYQGAGESGGADTATRDRTQSMSLGEDDDFWNTSVVDEELFDFLMNN
jgi:SHAQKYF class myb-like DNA-binding protein